MNSLFQVCLKSVENIARVAFLVSLDVLALLWYLDAAAAK